MRFTNGRQNMDESSALERTAVVFAAGGERVVPWEIGVVAGLADAGIDLRRSAAIVGTSAGALVAARLALGEDFEADASRIAREGVHEVPAEITARAAVALPRLIELDASTRQLSGEERGRRVGRFALAAETIPEGRHVAAVAKRLPAAEWPERLLLTAVDAETGERVVLGAHWSIPLARGVAASRAVPGVLPAVSAGGRRLIDAAVVSGTNADAAPADGIDRIVVITAAPADPEPGTVDAALELGLRRERTALAARGIEVEVIRADEAGREAIGSALYAVADAAGAVAAGRRTGRAAAGQRLAVGA